MNDADRKAFSEWAEENWVYVDDLINAEKTWQAACQWRDSQVGEPCYWVHNFGDEDGGEEFFDHPTGSDCPDCVPLYLAPPTAQINQQMFEALEFFVERFEPMRSELIFSKRLAIDKAKAALAAAKGQA